MKRALLILLLINLLVLIWYNWVDVAPRPTSPSIITKVPESQALKPISDQADTAVADNSSAMLNGDMTAIADSAAVGKKTPTSCFVGGSYETAAAATVLIEALALRNVRAEVRTAVSEEWNGYWVRAIGFSSKDSASAAIATLESAGIDDAYVLQDADGEGWLVSLGIFKNIASADAITAAAESVGQDVQVRDRYKSVGVFRVMVYADAAQLAELVEPDFIAGSIEAPCDSQF